MRKCMRKMNCWIMAVVLMVCIFAVPMTTQAASKNLKSSGVNFTLKKNKTTSIKTYYSHIGKKTEKIKITNYKITNAKKKGYKKLTFTITYKQYSGWTKKEAYAALESMDIYFRIGDWPYYAVVDYYTGKSLKVKNKQNVTVTDTGWKVYDKKLCYADDIDKIYAKKAKITVTVTYPNPDKPEKFCISSTF